MILPNISLKPYNSFGIAAYTHAFAKFYSKQVLEELLMQKNIDNLPKLVLGGGSNLLFTQNYNGLVLKNEILGIEKIKECENHVWVRAGAGQNWHQFVLHCIKNGWGGVENLSLIPGCAGASPMQNIGAYGVEIKDVFDSLEAFHIQQKDTIVFSKTDCEFGYRESVFKNKYKNEFIILNVTYKLQKQPIFNTSYGAIEQQLEKMGTTMLSIKAISDAVIAIRKSKLPDPEEVGNAGSFFKNPSIPAAQFEALKQVYPQIPGYPNHNGVTKLAAGWLIEQCGWKGYREGDAGVHPQQALVLVNYGSATGKQIFDLSGKIKESILEKFGIELEREVNIL